jgi:hypothetical protein
VVLDRRSVIEHLAARGVAVLPADPSLYTAAQVDMDAFGAPSAGRAPERGRPGSGHGEVVADWLRRIDAYLDDAKRKVRQVALGDLDYPRSPVAGALCVRQRDAFGVTQLGRDDEATWLGGARALVLNASHPLIRDAARLAVTEPELAAQLVAQAVCVAERGEPRRSAALAKMALSQRRARVRAATAAAKSDAKSGAKSASKSNRKAKR